MAQPLSRRVGTLPAFYEAARFRDVPGRGARADGRLAARETEEPQRHRSAAGQLAREKRFWKKDRQLGGSRACLSEQRASPGDGMFKQESQRDVSDRAADVVHQAAD